MPVSETCRLWRLNPDRLGDRICILARLQVKFIHVLPQSLEMCPQVDSYIERGINWAI